MKYRYTTTTSHRALASGQHQVHSSKRPCAEQMAWHGRIIAVPVCAADSRVEPQAPSPVDLQITQAPETFLVRSLKCASIEANNGIRSWYY